MVSRSETFSKCLIPPLIPLLQSLIAGGSFSLALLLMVITNGVAVFTVPPMLVWLTDLNSRVNALRFGILMLVFFLVTLLPTIVSNIVKSQPLPHP